MNNYSDSTFITNEGDRTLLSRFRALTGGAEFFDVLVAYFRTSGFHRLYESLDSVSKIRVLIGINMDRKAYELIESSGRRELNWHSSKEAKQRLRKLTRDEMENSEDSLETEKGINKFIEFLQTKKLEFRVYPKANIHAKVYIIRFFKDDKDYGRVVTGSSNFSEAGLEENLEFNVELKNISDVRFALKKFEELWEDSIDVTDDYIETIKTQTWMSQITPYEIYLKFLYEYFKEDIDLDEEEEDVYLPEGFKKLKYQLQAVNSAKKILDAYNGVFLADVVGLGKTFVSALLARQLTGRILVLCPPVLKDYWRDTFRDFGVRGSAVESHGKLDHVIRKGERYDYIFVDEAHRFRNEGTLGYEKLHEICFGKKVILVSATPLNNTIDDIYSQLKLFQIPRKSTIPGISNLEAYFSGTRKRLTGYDKADPEYMDAIKESSKNIRDELLRHVMVRRTRTEILNYFAEDLESQKLNFPKLADPRKIVYEFDDSTNDVFCETISLLRKFRYSRYTPLLYLKRKLTEFEKQSQRNIGGFMKGILVKRLESSFHAFEKTVGRFIQSYERFIDMYQNGAVYISRSVDVYDYLEGDDEEQLLELVDENNAAKVQKYDSEGFVDKLPSDLNHDLELLKKISSLWTHVKDDPKLEQFISDLKNEETLKKEKLIIFTESKETGAYLYNKLSGVFPDEIMFYSSNGGTYKEERLSGAASTYLIKENFDPNSKAGKNDIRLLVSTDILAEGINLHRSSVVVNYDLPWNPTRVLQRVGRINRIGTEHEDLHVYNFFPTSESDEHLGLERNIKSKIQAFHETLGEDAKYITDEEHPVAHELFGETLYRKLNDKRSYEVEEEQESELKYLKILRNVRDNNPELFERIKRLPKKARTALRHDGDTDALVTFFRRGKLKKFLVTDGSNSRELSFFEAVGCFECDPKTRGIKIPPNFYQLLQINKRKFTSLTSGEVMGQSQLKSSSNEGYVLKRLKAKEMEMLEDLTRDDKDFLKKTVSAFEYGIVPQKTIQKIKRSIEKEDNPLKIVSILRDTMPDSILRISTLGYTDREKSQVVLSQYISRAD